ncbi:hypothetical protein MGALLINA_00800 [Mycoplasmopsis gallinarum]|uniref:Uncharacterized protein n=2 Tax=Mycoplasmopsis gallinarum TaxID=29557 RepID=A0A168RP07_9BACT|nr:hypothetical protein MGALLINA_00800 [Mycoplasmopsis gallinarum]
MGKNGGYQFNNNYQNLTLKEIALSLEFEFLKNSWTSGQNQNYCMISQGMGKFMENLIYSINDEILNKLNNIKISDVEYKLTKI